MHGLVSHNQLTAKGSCDRLDLLALLNSQIGLWLMGPRNFGLL